jgi:hypothetical protein
VERINTNMNGKKAKKLRAMAVQMVTGPMKAKVSDGYNEYNQAMNRIDWAPQMDDKGFPMKDPDGVALMKPDKFPGTLTCAWKVRVMYQALKAQWKAKAHNRKV